MKKDKFTGVDLFYQKRAMSAIAQGALTNSKRPECLVKGVYPTHAIKGHGGHLYDTQGKAYVDFICGLGSNILGYGNEEVARSIYQRALLGCTLSIATPLEVEVSEKVKEIFPFIDRLKFLKTGSESCIAAIKIARAYQGISRDTEETDFYDRIYKMVGATENHLKIVGDRPKGLPTMSRAVAMASNGTSNNKVKTLILSDGYHGWSDHFVSLTSPHLGVPYDQNILPLTGNEDLIPNAACVIVEPVITDHSETRIEWLRELRKKCTGNNTILIFDEVITGFRFPRFSVSNYYGIYPDLICLGKAMANGMPISVVGGRKDIMECGEYFVSSTFAGETVSLAAALKTMTLLQTKFFLDRLWEKGELFQKRFNETCLGVVQIEGYPTRGILKGDPMQKALFMQEACFAGILFGPSFFFNFGHIDLMDQVLSTCSDIVTRIKTGQVELMGEMPTSPFAQKMRENK